MSQPEPLPFNVTTESEMKAPSFFKSSAICFKKASTFRELGLFLSCRCQEVLE